MKVFHVIAAALAVTLATGTATATEATDSTKVSTVVTNNGKNSTVTLTTSLPKNKKKSSSKRHVQTDSVIPKANDSIIAFSYTASFPNDTINEEDEAQTVIPLQGNANSLSSNAIIEHLFNHAFKILGKVLLLIGGFIALPILLILLIIYLTRRYSKKVIISNANAPSDNPNRVIPQNVTPIACENNICKFQGLLFDETTIISGIKYSMIGLGILIATLFIHGASFFIWVAIVLFFIGLGKILIALLPNLKYRAINVMSNTPEAPNTNAQATAPGTDEQEAPSAEKQPEVTKRKEKSEDYMPSFSSEDKEN
ncbi:MAG: hypothetical protein NC388_00975 [Clostridium sp.]|nr:hypothetical protein [Clostridium sp.]